MTTKKLAVEKRDVVGSGKLNALRAKGWVPGVVYGPAAGENINVQMKAADLRVLLGDDETDTILVSLQLEGKELLTLIKHVQHNHLKDTTTHVDFLAVTPSGYDGAHRGAGTLEGYAGGGLHGRTGAAVGA